MRHLMLLLKPFRKPVFMGFPKYFSTAHQKILNYSPRGKFYMDVYGCQMNFSDAEVAHSILQSAGYQKVKDVSEVCQSTF